MKFLRRMDAAILSTSSFAGHVQTSVQEAILTDAVEQSRCDPEGMIGYSDLDRSRKVRNVSVIQLLQYNIILL